jgi:hypothetical protein
MRWSLVLIALVTMCGCAAPAPVAPSDGLWKFSGTVSAMDGRQVAGPIAGARLTVVGGASGAVSVTSDASGHYVFEQLESGRINVVIEAPGFVSASPIVDLYHDTEVDFGLTRQ